MQAYGALQTGLAFLPLTTIAMADVPIADAGLAAGILNASQQISVAIGTAQEHSCQVA